LESVRAKLVERLPRIPELELLRLWPWWPWHPWWDCSPDIIFRVTQNCGGTDQVIVDRDYLRHALDVSSPLDVTLVANDLACCVDNTTQPEGNCINITHACSYPRLDHRRQSQRAGRARWLPKPRRCRFQR
jgi:hypothetical protein